MKIPKLNEKLIAKVLAHIKKDVRRLDQNTWGERRLPSELEGPGYTQKEYLKEWPACHTHACFAGWTVLLSTPVKKRNRLFYSGEMDSHRTEIKAQKLLRLTNWEAGFLFRVVPAYFDPKDQLRILEARLGTIREDRKR